MASRLVIFDTSSLANLLTHFSEGCLPLGMEIKNIATSKMLQEWIAVIAESESWEDTPLAAVGYGMQQPYIFRFAHGKVLNWGDRHEELRWSEEGAIEAPRRTD